MLRKRSRSPFNLAAISLAAGMLAGCASDPASYGRGPVASAQNTQMGTQPGQGADRRAAVQPDFSQSYDGIYGRPAGPEIVRWGFNTYNNAAYEGCFITQRFAIIANGGRMVYETRVVGAYPNKTRATCSVTGGILGPLFDSIPYNPYRPY